MVFLINCDYNKFWIWFLLFISKSVIDQHSEYKVTQNDNSSGCFVWEEQKLQLFGKKVITEKTIWS
jgi:hypothetical protein